LDLLLFNFGYEPINWNEKLKNDYLKACIFGAKGNNVFMEKIIKNGLRKIEER